MLNNNNIVTLKSELGVTEGHWKWYHSKAYGYGFLFVGTMAVSLAVYEIYSIK